jgi:hypothetical protein
LPEGSWFRKEEKHEVEVKLKKVKGRRERRK